MWSFQFNSLTKTESKSRSNFSFSSSISILAAMQFRVSRNALRWIGTIHILRKHLKGGQKIVLIADFQYIKCAYIGGEGVKKAPNCAYVTYECTCACSMRLCTKMPTMLTAINTKALAVNCKKKCNLLYKHFLFACLRFSTHQCKYFQIFQFFNVST